MQWTVGDARITAISEQPLHHIERLMPQATREGLDAIPWLKPHFIDSAGVMTGLVQSFVVETGGRTLLIDTCVGDGKDLPLIPDWHKAVTGFLDRFRAAGFAPEGIDTVLCTHLHMDHVGWNTTWDGEAWRPTFPHARHLFARAEVEFWERETTRLLPPGPDGAPTIAHMLQQVQASVSRESVRPILDAGLADLVDPPCEPLPGVRLVPTPGHTPGHVSVEITSKGETAFITGDSFHHPCQVARPDWGTITDTDLPQGCTTRRELLESFAGGPVTVIGSHFSVPTGGRIMRDGDTYRFAVHPAGNERT